MKVKLEEIETLLKDKVLILNLSSQDLISGSILARWPSESQMTRRYLKIYNMYFSVDETSVQQIS